MYRKAAHKAKKCIHVSSLTLLKKAKPNFFLKALLEIKSCSHSYAVQLRHDLQMVSSLTLLLDTRFCGIRQYLGQCKALDLLFSPTLFFSPLHMLVPSSHAQTLTHTKRPSYLCICMCSRNTDHNQYLLADVTYTV